MTEYYLPKKKRTGRLPQLNKRIRIRDRNNPRSELIVASLRSEELRDQRGW